MKHSDETDESQNKLSSLELVPLPGSEKPPAPGFAPAAAKPLAAEANIEVTLILRRKADPDQDSFAEIHSAAELAEKYGAASADLTLTRTTLTGLGLTVMSSDAGTRRVRVSGSAALMARVFGTELQSHNALDASGSDFSYRHRSGGLSIPAALDGVVTAVLGLDDRPQSHTLFRFVPAAARSTSYTPVQLGTIYNFPSELDGTGQRIAIIELGGGFVQADLDSYFHDLSLKTPTVKAIGVDGGANQPDGNPHGPDGEVMLDIEVAGALAPGAEILVYFAPNTDAGFVDAVSAAAHATPAPAAISISWGQNEDGWTEQARNAFDAALADAALLGVTVTAAAGDDGSTDRAPDGKSHVDFPASSPHALACGGTRLDADPSSGKVRAETVWNNGPGNGATGGGVSRAFALPGWQGTAGVPVPAGKAGRGVPDVSAVADPETGYLIRVDGQNTVIGGTSAVAPLWAALLARLAQARGRGLGLIQPAIYAQNGAGKVPPGFRDIVSGNNGAFSANPGWDACTGLGVPDGAKLLARLSTP
ncbi:kumamolisin [Psychromicrobium silvestre]|uniref:Kumamolisin n=1 Tax=Psychromicrobium silvestre TaxID=1645614 RepID=A0A7Y9LT05_9MICC|nr:S53 family peptidase [Psychromicrobium silvestre]NYE95065.1 kumamolisin [Psychromicrobium silvestre]